QRLRLRAGDDIAIGADGARFRFGGVGVSRTFALTPNLATYPAPRFAGEALSASTVELYVDGALRAREQVEVGPFVLEHAPGAQGPGMAEIVVRDALGREQASRQPFFVTPDLLRPGLSDWIIAAGMLRQSFALDSNDYDDGFVAARYRRGISGALTLEGGFEHSARSANAFLGAAFADPLLGQFRFAHMHGEGAFMSATWLRTARSWSIGAQYDARDRETRTLATRERDTPLQSAAGHLFFDLGDAGNVSFTAASIRFDDEPSARTASATYTPDMQDGALSFRVLYVEQDEAELVFGLSYSLMLGDASAQVGADVGRAQSIYRVGAQSRPPALGGLGWRARASGGDRGRLDVATTYRGAHGESDAQLVRTDDFTGLRLGHRGSVGVVEGEHFAGRSIDGAFALVDAGAAGVRVTRDRLALGRTDAGGRLLITNLRPYDANTIAIDARDLPFDAAAPSTSVRVAPRGSAGVLVRFAEPHARLIETQARFPDGAPAPRGAILLRARDDARFPVGSDGRVVLTDAAIGDIVRLNSQATCTARADEAAAAVGLYLLCEATP
ncbi:MAG: fimbria/pilus outer membrane usher protein, partial [Hyphomonadaceae bacterium]